MISVTAGARTSISNTYRLIERHAALIRLTTDYVLDWICEEEVLIGGVDQFWCVPMRASVAE